MIRYGAHRWPEPAPRWSAREQAFGRPVHCRYRNRQVPRGTSTGRLDHTKVVPTGVPLLPEGFYDRMTLVRNPLSRHRAREDGKFLVPSLSLGTALAPPVRAL